MRFSACLVYREVLRNEIFGWLVALNTPFYTGLARSLFAYALGTWAARRRAAARGDAAATREDAVEGLLAAYEVVRDPPYARAILRDEPRLLAFFRGCRFGPL